MTLIFKDTEGLHALVGGELNDFKLRLECRNTEGLHALVGGELNDFR